MTDFNWDEDDRQAAAADMAASLDTPDFECDRCFDSGVTVDDSNREFPCSCQRTKHGFPFTALGLQAEAWTEE